MERRTVLTSGVGSGAIAVMAIGLGMPVAAESSGSFAHFKIDGAMVLQAYRSLVEEHLAGVLRTLRTLAATADARTGNWATVSPPLLRLKNDLSTAAAIWFAQPDGSYATTDKGQTDLNLKDRPYFPDVLAGHDAVGNLVVSKSTGQRSIVVATPVVNQGQVIGVIGASLSALSISQMVINRVGMPDSLTFYAIDAHGQTAIHKTPEKMFEYPSDLGDQSLQSAIQIITLQPSGMVNYRLAGIDRKAIFDMSKLTGWHFVLVQLAK